MANSALYSDKSAPFASASTTTILIDKHVGNVGDITPIPVTDGSGSRVFTFSVTTSNAPTGAIEYSYNGGAYQTAVASPSGLTNSFQLTIPIGTHTLQCRLAENGEVSQVTTLVASRFVILGTGQSNMRGTGDAATTLDTSTSGHTAWLLRNSDNVTEMISVWDTGSSQVDLVSYDSFTASAWMIRYANALLAEYDEPVICIPSALGGSTIEQNRKGSSYSVDGLTIFDSSVRRVNLIGGATLNIYQQGENDAVDSTGTTNQSYQGTLSTLVDDYYSDLGIPTLIIPLHNITRDNYNGTLGSSLTDNGQEALRAAQIAVASNNSNAYIAAPLTDVDLTDGDDIHFKTSDELSAVANVALKATQQFLGGVVKTVSFSGDSVEYGDSVALSLTTDITPQTYITWAQVNNGAPSVAIADPHAASTTFTAPSEDANIEIAAYVSDGEYVALDQKTFNVAAVANVAPTANAGIDQSDIAAGATVQLDGSASTDGDGTIVSYAWAQTGTGTAVILTGASTATPSFTAPSTANRQDLEFTLTVTDNNGLTDTDTVTVDVLASSARPFFINKSRNFDFFDKDGIWTDNLRVTEVDSYTFTIDPAWISPETIIDYSVTPSTGVTVEAHSRQDNVIQIYLHGDIVGRNSVRVDFETATRSDHAMVYLDVVS